MSIKHGGRGERLHPFVQSQYREYQLPGSVSMYLNTKEIIDLQILCFCFVTFKSFYKTFSSTILFIGLQNSCALCLHFSQNITIRLHFSPNIARKSMLSCLSTTKNHMPMDLYILAVKKRWSCLDFTTSVCQITKIQTQLVTPLGQA